MDKKDKKKLQQRAAESLKKKLLLEKTFKPVVSRFLKGLNKDFAVIYSKTGKVLSLDPYTTTLENVLKRHYKTVSIDFTAHNTVLFKKNNDLKLEIKAVNEFVTKLTYIINNRAEEQAKNILKTSSDKYFEKAKRFVEEIEKEGIAFDSVEDKYKAISNKVKADMDSEIEFRAEMIAITETQNIAENTKQLSIEVNAGIGNVPTKVWVAILDEKTRNAHAMADFQDRPYDKPFDVMGEQLMFPGDTSLGASKKNVINCRCSSEVYQNGI